MAHGPFAGDAGEAEGDAEAAEADDAEGDAIEALALDAATELTFAERVNEALAASSTALIELTEDETLDTQVTIPASKQLSIDLKGYTLSCTGGTPFALNNGSTLVVFDHSEAKSGAINTNGSTLLTQANGSSEKINFIFQSGHISCSLLASGVTCMQLTLSGGSVSMTARMNVASNVWVDIQGSCSVTSSASDGAFRVNNGGSLDIASTARVSYTGAGAVFDLNGGTLTLGSGATASGNITATNGNIVLFEKKSNATINNVTIVCDASHSVFTATGTGTSSTIKFLGGTLPDSSILSFLPTGEFCVHDPGAGYFVTDDAPYIYKSCVGTVDGVYYTSEDDFANASGAKVRFEVVQFSFDASEFAGTSLAGKTELVHVKPGMKLSEVPGFALDTAPAKAGCTFKWMRSSTGVAYSPEEVLSLPISASAQAYSFVGKYVENAVEPDPGPVDPDPDPPTPPDPPVPPGPVDPDPPVGPVGPGGGEGEGEGGPGGLVTQPTPSTPNVGAVVSPGAGSRPRTPAPSTPWNPPGLALAAGFTVPESGAGVVVLDEFGQPVLAAAEAGAGDGDGDDDALAEAGELYQADANADGARITISAGDVARAAAVVGGVAVIALLAVKIAGFLSANAAAGAAAAGAGGAGAGAGGAGATGSRAGSARARGMRARRAR